MTRLRWLRRRDRWGASSIWITKFGKRVGCLAVVLYVLLHGELKFRYPRSREPIAGHAEEKRVSMEVQVPHDSRFRKL